MVCPRCLERGKTWDGDSLKCAFKLDYKDYRVSFMEYATEETIIHTKVFHKNNWNCATMNNLRSIIHEQAEKGFAYYNRDDNASASIGVLPFETENYQGNLILTWYKDRGKTGNAIIVQDDDKPRRLTLDIAEEILAK